MSGTGRSAANRRIAAEKASSQSPPKLASFREDSGENRALQVENGASARALAESGGAGPFADIRGGKAKPIVTAKKGPKPVTGQIKSSNNYNEQKPRKSSKFGSLRYPKKEIQAKTDYLQIDVLQYKPAGLDLTKQENNTLRSLKTSKGNYNSTKKEDILGTIFLPIPQNISSTNSTGWGEDSINSFEAMGLGLAAGAMTADSFFGGLVGAVKGGAEGVKTIAQSGEAQGLANAFFASKVVNALGGNTSFEGVLARSTGQILNPNTELLFNGIKLRSFNFSFNLAPRNVDEAVEIKKIMRALKINMSPSTTVENGNATGIFLQSPNVFRLKYMTGSSEHKFLNKFIIAALTNVQVNYTGSGTYMTYNDDAKTPVHMVMQLSFQELNPVYAEDYDNESGTIGVGY